MADNLNIEAEVTAESLARLREEIRRHIETSIDADDALEKIIKTFDKGNSVISKFAFGTVTAIEKQFRNLEKEVKKTGGSYKDTGARLERLQDVIDESTELQRDAMAKQRMQNRLDLMARQAYADQMMDMGKQMLGKVATGFAEYYMSQVKTGVLGALGEGSPFQVAADLQIAMIDSVSSTASGLAKTAQSAGQALGSIPNHAAMAAGALLSVGGAVLEFTSSKAAELLKLKVQITSQALDKAYTSFIQATNAGITFGNGLDELRKVALDSGLTQEQFTNILSKNNAVLAESGLTVTEAARKVSGVTKTMAGQIGSSGLYVRDELLNLGFSIEEQVGLAAQVVAKFKQTGAFASDPQLAAATAEYAKNLRFLANLTGDEAKQKEAAAQQAINEYAVISELMRRAQETNDPNLVERNKQALQSMTDTFRTGVIQAFALNGAITDTASNVLGMGDAQREVARRMRDGGYTISEIIEPMARYNDEFKRGGDAFFTAINQSALAVGKNTETSKASSEQLQNSFQVNSETLAKVTTNLTNAQKPTGDFNEGVRKSVIELQNLRNMIQNELTGAITKFADDVPKIMEEFRAKLVELGLLTGPGGPSAVASAAANTAEARSRVEALERKEKINALGSITGAVDSPELRKARQDLAIAARQQEDVTRAQKVYEKALKTRIAEEQRRINVEASGGGITGQLKSLFVEDVALTLEQKRKIEERFRTEEWQKIGSEARGDFMFGTPYQTLPQPQTMFGQGSVGQQQVEATQQQTSAVQKLLDTIAAKESGGSYTKVYGGREQANLTEMTLGEVRALQQTMKQQGAVSTAMGKYQIIGDTLEGLIKEGYARREDKFSPEMQEKLARVLLEKQGFGQFQAGRMSPEEFADRVAKVWAAVPDRTGRSVYEGVAGNRALMTRAEIIDALSGIPKKAKGGITDGLSVAGEAGPEAVVPLPDGKTIPVRLENDPLQEALRTFAELRSISQLMEVRPGDVATTISPDLAADTAMSQIMGRIWPEIQKGFESGALSVDQFRKMFGPADAEQIARAAFEKTKNIPTFAKGGITDGVSIAGEAGPEAVVPLPDGKNIPTFAKGGITDGVSIAGEAGPEAVVPLPDGKNIPIQFEPKTLEAFRAFAEMYSMSSMAGTSAGNLGNTAFQTDADTTAKIQNIFEQIMPAIIEEFKSGRMTPEDWQRSLGIIPDAEIAAKAAEITSSIKSFKEGGISQGPESGYLANLHGNEAVVPLGNNKSIPVEVDNSNLENAIQAQTGLLQQILRVMEKNNNIASGILQANY